MVDNIHDYRSFSVVIHFLFPMDKIYRIIWADDEIDALLDENGKAVISQHHVEVVKCYNGTMLEEKLRNTSHRIDAVIVDANFAAKDYIPDEKDVTGFRRATRLMGEYRHLPFYLYTGRVNLSNLVDEDDLSYFKDNDAIIFKSDNLSPLLDRIKSDVDKYNSAEFQIDNQYKDELNYFQKFDKLREAKSYMLVRKLLIQSREGSLDGTEDYFNQFRTKILDNMNTVASHFGIVPEELSLNDFSRFLCLSEVEVKEKKYKLNKEVLPKALHMLMQYVVRMVQDGSHDVPNLQYGVHRFVSDNRDKLIIPSLLFAIIEAMSWFVPYLEKHTDKLQNIANWQKHTEDGIIEKDEKGYYHIGNEYSVLLKNIDLLGMKVKIKHSTRNNNPKTQQYPYFVREEDFELIE